MTYLFCMIFLLAIFFIPTLQLACGGNCPGGNCPQCICGVQKNYANSSVVRDHCNGHFYETRDKNCCACIISATSGGNRNFMQYNNLNDYYLLGVMGLNSELVKNRCLLQPQKVCYSLDNNLACAIIINLQDGDWRSFPTAKQCGCYTGQIAEE